MSAQRARVHVISTGGTIACRPVSPTQVTGYSSFAFTADQLLAGIPGLDRYADVTAEQLFSVGSSALSDENLLTLARRVEQVLASGGADGVVVTHGTDTMEETAFFLHLTVHSDKPVIVTGSMRPSSVLSADGPLNLLNSIAAAADSASRGMGVMLCLGDLLLSARDAMKTSTYRTDAFQCMEGGVLGSVIGAQAYYSYAPVRPHTLHSEFSLGRIESLPHVEVVYTHIGCTDLLLRSAAENGCRGIVIAGTGNGSVPPVVRDFFSAPGRPVWVRSSRVPGGRVGLNGGVDDEALGAVAGCGFSPHKARILLQLALTVTNDIPRIRDIFARY